MTCFCLLVFLVFVVFVVVVPAGQIVNLKLVQSILATTKRYYEFCFFDHFLVKYLSADLLLENEHMAETLHVILD